MNNPSEPFVYIIIANYNGIQYLPACLNSLLQQTYVNYKILLIDDCSADDSVEYIKKNYPDIQIMQNEHNQQFAKSNNIAAKFAFAHGADYIVLLNQDTVVDKKWLYYLIITAQKSKNIGLVQSKILLYNTSLINTDGNKLHYLGFGFCGNYKKNNSDSDDHEITYPSGASVLIKKKVYRETRLFDEKFIAYHEDLDLGWRARMLGYKIYLSDKSIVWHKYSFHKNKKKFYFMERNRLFFLLQNFELRTLCLIFPVFIFMEIGLLLYSLINGWFFLKLKSYIDVIKKIKDVHGRRKYIQRNRIVQDKDMIKYLADQLVFDEINSKILKKIINPLLKKYYYLISFK